MRVALGTKNTIKLEAVTEAFVLYHIDIWIYTYDVPTHAASQPLSFTETKETGAFERALGAFEQYKAGYGREPDIALGIESGVDRVGEKVYEGTWVCMIYKGEVYYACSSIWECPKDIADLLFIHEKTGKDPLDLSQIAKKLGMTYSDTIGQEQGIVGLVTKGVLTRKEYTKHAVIMALIHVK